MNLLQTIWSVLTTPNMQMANILTTPFIIIESWISMLLFTTIMNINSNKVQKILYVIVLSITGFITKFLVQAPFSNLFNMLLIPCIILFTFKVSIKRSIVCELIPFTLSAILDTFIIKLYSTIFDMSYYILVSTPLHKILCSILIYVILFIFYFLAKYYNFNINILDTMTQKNKLILLSNSFFAIIAILSQYYIAYAYLDRLPISIVLLSLLSLTIYILLSIYNFINTTKLEITKRDLEETKMYNKTLGILHDNIRGFKHDFGNIVQTIGGYVATEDIKGLKRYYSQLLEDCQRANNLAALNPTIINNPAIYSLLASKYYIANEQGITINLEVLLDLNSINMKIYEFTRVLGILLDNAIEASSQCNEKIINISFRNNEKKNMQEIIIQNTYNNKDINIDEIFQKGYTSKTLESENSHGLGLWEIRQILKKRNNLNLYTTKSEKYFTQQLEIYL